MRISLMILALGATLISSTCTREPIIETTTAVKVQFIASYDEAPFLAGQWYDYSNTLKIQIKQFNFYISDLVMRKQIVEMGDETELKEIDFVDFSGMTSEVLAENGVLIVEADIAVGDYTGLELGIGVASDLNRTKPIEYAPDHPLQTETHYRNTWESFVFAAIEGEADENGDGESDFSFLYEVGMDDLYKEKIIVNHFTLTEDSPTNIKLNVDFKRLLGTGSDFIDIAGHPMDTDDLSIGRKISGNFLDAISLK